MYQMRQNRRLIAGTGTNFQHPGLRRQFEQLRHSRHHIGLRNRLTLAYRQSDIFPGLMFKRFINKFLARHCSKRIKHLLISDALRAQLFKKSLYTSTYHCVPTPTLSNQSETTSCALCAVKSTCNGVTET